MKRKVKFQIAKKKAPTEKTLVKMIKKVSLGTQETKYSQSHGENVQLYHNGGVGNTTCQLINQLGTSVGTAQSNRLGDEVNAIGLKVRLWLSNKGDRPNVNYRIIAVSVPRDQWNAAGPSSFFEVTNLPNVINPINKDHYKVLYDKVVHIGSDSFQAPALQGKEQSRIHTFYLPFKGRKIKYESDNGVIPKYQNNIISVGVMAYDSYGTLTSDNIASFAYHTCFYFKDA